MLTWLTSKNMTSAPRAEPTWVTTPQENRYPLSLQSPATQTLTYEKMAPVRSQCPATATPPTSWLPNISGLRRAVARMYPDRQQPTTVRL